MPSIWQNPRSQTHTWGSLVFPVPKGVARCGPSSRLAEARAGTAAIAAEMVTGVVAP